MNEAKNKEDQLDIFLLFFSPTLVFNLIFAYFGILFPKGVPGKISGNEDIFR